MAFLREGILLIFAMAVASTATPAAPANGQGALLDRLRTAYEAAQRDCKANYVVFDKTMEEKGFGALSEPVRAASYHMAAYCATQVNDDDAAGRYATEGTRLPNADPWLWRLRLGTELKAKRNAEAVVTVEMLAKRNPDALNTIPIQWLYGLNRDLQQTPDRSLQRRLLIILAAAGYQPDEVLTNNDGFKSEYAAMLADAGDRAGAMALVAGIANPWVLVQDSLDPRLRASLPPDFDGRAATEQWLAYAREVSASHAGSMAAILEISRSLRQLGRAPDALATLEAARPDGVQAASFTDLDEKGNWWWDELARTYQMLGRYDDMVAAFRKGMEAKERGSANVSQTINLAYGQLRFGRPADALKTVAPFENGAYETSPYGTMELRRVRGCAHIAAGQAAAADADIAYAKAHEKDHPEALTDLLLCAAALDDAAAAIIRRLDDPDRRVGALLQLSDFDASLSGPSQLPFETRLPELKARADVQAAIKRAGGTRRFHLQADE